jgi:hypothetical protein
MWQELPQNKYIRDKTLSQVQVNPNDSPFWKGIMGGKDDSLIVGLSSLEMEKILDFWEDMWLGGKSLSSQYPALYNIITHKNVRVADVLASTPLNINFRQVLRDDTWEPWLNLVQRLTSIQLNDEPDRFSWNLTSFGVFSVKSLYADLFFGAENCRGGPDSKFY